MILCREERFDLFTLLNKREINLFVIPVFDSYPHPAKDFEWYYELWKD